MSIAEVYETTKEGLEKLMRELRFRENGLRKKIANELSDMRGQGDLRENDGYSMAIEEQQINEQKILELKKKIQKAKIVKQGKKDRIGIGNKVTLKNKKKIQYTITTEDEANPLKGKISHQSPIGKAIMGKKIGDLIKIETPKGSIEYSVEKIS